jgi:hypothetical protein
MKKKKAKTQQIYSRREKKASPAFLDAVASDALASDEAILKQ